ncbi:hypothetical protein J3L16_09160 [Alteromonas sp. 5E99-2]|uniref:hypothetical protein n=1 Tax=Alteromonas sp. 5E99-2 TaxID=2817683 RepID=UPI001A98B084|nr:hypothetical protein [Alteromonas sp. 5E99-2]MBO1255850.1 hypothetical protein [Alteromonas sp. 5E99-2]
MFSVFTIIFGIALAADPTRPEAFVEDENLKAEVNVLPSLEAIFITPAGKKAIVNGNVYLEAQVLNGLKVVKINANSVEVDYQKNGETQRVLLSLSEVSVVSKSVSEIQ